MADPKSILIVRLGAMGDIIHALPAATSLKQSFPNRPIVWLVARKWLSLLEGNPCLDTVIPFDRKSVSDLSATWKLLRAIHPAVAIDFQGLVQSAVAGRVARPNQFIGLDKSLARESAASWFYTTPVHAVGPHRVQRCLQLASAAGATTLTEDAWLPPGQLMDNLPNSPFVLASPFAGWVSKQWPIEYYDALGGRLAKSGLPLIVNVPESRAPELRSFPNLQVQSSSIEGLLYTSRKAAAVVGVDSGPLHMAAALKKPGVAIYGPTDPAQTGPFNSSIQVLRSLDAVTSYKREDQIHPSMRSITVEQVANALLESMRAI